MIISALSDIILIVEAREKSGTLSTVEAALDMSKSVYAIPGAVNDELSAGCNRLIYEGAVIAWRPEVLLDEWCLSPISPEEQKKSRPGLTEEQKLVFGALGSRPRSMDYLIRQTGLPSEKIGKYVVELCLMGCIKGGRPSLLCAGLNFRSLLFFDDTFPVCVQKDLQFTDPFL